MTKVCAVVGSPFTVHSPYPLPNCGAAGILAVLTQFGLNGTSRALLAAGGVCQIWSPLSLQRNVHQRLGSLDLWHEVRLSETCYYRRLSAYSSMAAMPAFPT